MEKLRVLYTILFTLISIFINAQNILNAKITDSHTGEPLLGVVLHIKNTNISGISNAEGVITISNIPSGNYIISYKVIGYMPIMDSVIFPQKDIEVFYIKLISIEEEINEIEVSSTRSGRTIKDEPSRVEFIAGEELEEKANMKPGDIRMLLAESTGIQTQQTSATSANSSIRIQGLDGRFTQILKDGFPLYSGFSGNLGLLQTPPLDLKQAEVIKGSVSTLYGGGAIAGMVNLISKTPEDGDEIKLLINGTSAMGLDINGFYSKKFKKIGTTIYAARNSNKAYDPSNIGLTAIPEFERYTLNPKIYFYPNKNFKINIGVSAISEKRKGGNIKMINGDIGLPEYYFEMNETKRISSTFEINYIINKNKVINFKSSHSYYYRKLSEMFYQFNGKQNNIFSEMSYSIRCKKADWLAGINFINEEFEHLNPVLPFLYNLSYSQSTIGVFAQNILRINKKITIESGLRNDYALEYGNALLPRVSVLYKINPLFTSRIGSGIGYKIPSVFNEATERILYRNLKPVNIDKSKLETSYGINGDINYRNYFENSKISVNANILLFYTKINSPFILKYVEDGFYYLKNIDGYIDTRGIETNIKVSLGDFKLFLGHTYTDVKLKEGSNFQTVFLTPKHRMNNVLMYELEGKWKLGLEAYYFSKQKLSDGKTGKSYWICGFMAEKLWEKFSVYINFENFLDVRQTRFDTIYTGSINNPAFRDIYAPLDGFVINGGVKYFPFGDKCCKK